MYIHKFNWKVLGFLVVLKPSAETSTTLVYFKDMVQVLA